MGVHVIISTMNTIHPLDVCDAELSSMISLPVGCGHSIGMSADVGLTVDVISLAVKKP